MTAGVTTALGAWGFTTGFTAIILAVAVDMMAASVNAYKTCRHPAGESMLSWWLFLAATLAALPGSPARRTDPVRVPRRRRAHRHRSNHRMRHRQTGSPVTAAGPIQTGAGHHAPNPGHAQSERSQQLKELTRSGNRDPAGYQNHRAARFRTNTPMRPISPSRPPPGDLCGTACSADTDRPPH